MKLGFAVHVLGKTGLKSSDGRRWQNGPHLSVSLAYLRDILAYLKQSRIRMYRLSPALVPYATHPDLPQFHEQIADCGPELAAAGALAREDGVRLSVHPGAHVHLSSPGTVLAERAARSLNAQAALLDSMGLGPEAVVVIHIGGAYDNRIASMERFVVRVRELPEATRRRLVLENDDRCYTLCDTYAIHRRTGLRLVYDWLHDRCNPSPELEPGEALHLALSTWPADQTPKVHYSSPSTGFSISPRRSAARTRRRVRAPRLSRHADLIDPFAFAAFLSSAHGERDFDVMLECRARDIALLRLRKQLARLYPALVTRHRIS